MDIKALTIKDVQTGIKAGEFTAGELRQEFLNLIEKFCKRISLGYQ